MTAAALERPAATPTDSFIKDAAMKPIDLKSLFARRDFLRWAGGCGMMSSTSLASVLLHLKMTNVATAAIPGITGYKALVCVFLSGGNDSYNMLIPNGSEYTAYSNMRTGLAVPQANLLSISPLNTPGRTFGLHPSLPGLQSLFNSGKLAFMANVGSLVRPTTLTDYNARNQLPQGLFSHSDEVRSWQTSTPHTRNQATGWAGRMADILTDPSAGNPNIFMHVALNSVNVLQTGTTVFPYVVGTSGATQLAGYGGTSAMDQILTSTTNSLLNQTYNELLARSYARIRKDAIDAANQYTQALTGYPTPVTTFPNTTLGNQLRMVARSIKTRTAMQPSGQEPIKRQVFFVSYGSWDHHAGLMTSQPTMLTQVNDAITAFWNEMVAQGEENNILLFTFSDFARTLTSNGQGSDHGWGGNAFVLGGQVQGQRIFGNFPTNLQTPTFNSASIDTGRGRLIPTTAADQYHAEMAMWFGIPNDTNLQAILPNIRNFYNSGVATRPLGFTA